MKIPWFRSVPVFLFTCLSVLTLLLTFDHFFQSVEQFYDGPGSFMFSSDRQLTAESDDLANYNNPNDPYSPTMQVEYGHKLTNKDFEANTAYIQRALYTPIVIFGLGFLAIFFYLCGLLWRCCCECCRCLPDADDVQYDYKRTTNTVFFYLFVLFVLIFDQLVFIGNTNIDTGITTLDGALGDIHSLTTTVVDNTGYLIDVGADMKTTFDSLYTYTQQNCPGNTGKLNDISDAIDVFRTVTKSLNKAMSTMPDNIVKVQDYLAKYAMTYRQIGIYVIWALAIVCGILFLIAKIVESMVTMKVAVSLGVITYLLYILLGIPWVLITSIGGDFCMDPTYNLVKSAPKGDIRNMLRYYTSCVGNSTIDGYITDSAKEINKLNSTLNAFRAVAPNCGYQPEVTDLFVGIHSVNTSVNAVIDVLDCTNIRGIYFDIINKGFCEELYTGIFYIWGSQLVTSFCLFVLMIIASVSYQYFDIARVVPLTSTNEEEDDAPKMELVEMGDAGQTHIKPNNNHNNANHNSHQGDAHHNAQAYASVGYFDNGLSP